jgi:DNA-binding IscR family transcriptional regulator
MLHVLLHMHRHQGSFNSDQIAKMLGTHPVVVRRTLSSLRKAGYVCAITGRGGGWQLSPSIDHVTLLDVHRAVSSPNVFAFTSGDQQASCAVERVVNRALASTMGEAEKLLLTKLGEVTLGALSADFDAICKSEGWDGNTDKEN